MMKKKIILPIIYNSVDDSLQRRSLRKFLRRKIKDGERAWAKQMSYWAAGAEEVTKNECEIKVDFQSDFFNEYYSLKYRSDIPQMNRLFDSTEGEFLSEEDNSTLYLSEYHSIMYHTDIQDLAISTLNLGYEDRYFQKKGRDEIKKLVFLFRSCFLRFLKYYFHKRDFHIEFYIDKEIADLIINPLIKLAIKSLHRYYITHFISFLLDCLFFEDFPEFREWSEERKIFEILLVLYKSLPSTILIKLESCNFNVNLMEDEDSFYLFSLLISVLPFFTFNVNINENNLILHYDALKWLKKIKKHI